VSGVLVDPTGARITNATVKILKGETQVAVVSTGEDGEFSFENLDAGDYQIRAESPGFRTASFHVVVVKPKASSRRMLLIRLVTSDGCTGIESVKSNWRGFPR